MEELMNNVIDQVTGEWIINHQDMMIKYGGRDVEFGDYILMQITHNYVEKLEKEYKIFIELKRKENPLYLKEEAVEELGYSIEDIKSPKFSELVYKILKSKKTNYIDIIGKGDYKLVDPFTMTVRNNKKITFNGLDLEKGVKRIVPKIRNFDPDFVKTISEKIVQVKSQEQEEVKEMIYNESNEDIVKPRERFYNETDEEYINYLKEFYGGGSSK